MNKATIHKLGNVINLRDWNDADIQPLKKWLSLGKEWQKLDAPYYLKTQKKFEEQISSIENQLKEKYITPRTRVVISEKKSNLILGTVSCYWNSVETNWLSAGITIYDPGYWGRGIGYEALGLWAEYLFENYSDIIRLDLRTWSGNIGLIKLAKKLGFREEARFRKARIVNGEYFDSLGFGILKEEFISKYPNGFEREISTKVV